MDEMVGMGRGWSIWEVRMDEVVEVEDGGGGKDFDHGSGIEPDLKVFVHDGKG